jgi:hypothetical protein
MWYNINKGEVKLKDNSSYLGFVLDRSGSMATIKEATITGFNKFVSEQKLIPGECKLTLMLFDDKFEVPYDGVELKTLPELDDKTFVPRGWTALYDGIGRTIDTLGAKFAAMPESERPSKVVIVVMTDGAENASREYSQAKVKEMIQHQTQRYQWQFLFLGANQDAIFTGEKIGILNGYSMTYNANAASVGNTFSSASRNIGSYRINPGTTMDSFSKEDRINSVVSGNDLLVTIPDPSLTNSKPSDSK